MPCDATWTFFTARGEAQWAEGRTPRFYVAEEDDSRPGTTFDITRNDHRATWIVVHRYRGPAIAYARFVPDKRATRVSVFCEAARDTSTTAVPQFAEHFPRVLDPWQAAIGTDIAQNRRPGR